MYVVSARLQSLTGKSIHNLFDPKLTLMWSSDLRFVCCFYFSLVQFKFSFYVQVFIFLFSNSFHWKMIYTYE